MPTREARLRRELSLLMNDIGKIAGEIEDRLEEIKSMKPRARQLRREITGLRVDRDRMNERADEMETELAAIVNKKDVSVA